MGWNPTLQDAGGALCLPRLLPAFSLPRQGDSGNWLPGGQSQAKDKPACLPGREIWAKNGRKEEQSERRQGGSAGPECWHAGLLLVGGQRSATTILDACPFLQTAEI